MFQEKRNDLSKASEWKEIITAKAFTDRFPAIRDSKKPQQLQSHGQSTARFSPKAASYPSVIRVKNAIRIQYFI